VAGKRNKEGEGRKKEREGQKKVGEKRVEND